MMLNQIYNNLLIYKNETSFVINETKFSYEFLKKRVYSVFNKLVEIGTKPNDIVVVYTDDHIDTYASVLAIFFIGATFVPINSMHPAERNQLILNQILPKVILSTKDIEKSINTVKISSENTKINFKYNEHNIAYILFTSGSTGIPKGVEVTYKNINSFILNFSQYFGKLTPNDRFLQIYDLTFDASLHCYLLPLFLGASVYTVPPNKMKFLHAYKLMEKYKLTFAKFPPTVINLLKPFFAKINLPNLKYSLLGGEEFRTNLAVEWKKCVPSAQIYNVYGPTEATINTHIYPLNIKSLIKNYNGVISIGKTFGQNKAKIINDNNSVVETNIIGELIIGGEQVANGYLNNKIKTKDQFFYSNGELFYKTGDLAYIDDEGDFIFVGRKDNQVQIQGYRVELSEIHEVALKYNNQLNYAVVTIQNKFDTTEVVLFVENTAYKEKLHDFLTDNLPHYMLPSKIINLKSFPLLTSGKIDKNKLKTIAFNE